MRVDCIPTVGDGVQYAGRRRHMAHGRAETEHKPEVGHVPLQAGLGRQMQHSQACSQMSNYPSANLPKIWSL
eukprot:4808337-Pyramimonas_sp.AAC.1